MSTASTPRSLPLLALDAGRQEAHALARQAWRMGKRGVQLRRFQSFWRRRHERLRAASEDELLEEQSAALRGIVRFAARAIPHYRDLFRSAGLDPESVRDARDLRRLPILTRADIRAGFPDRLVHPGKSFRPYMLGRTSGSSSESMSFIRPPDRFRRSLYYSVLWRCGGSTRAQVYVLSTPICTPNTCSLDAAAAESRARRSLARVLHGVAPVRHLGGMIGLPSTSSNVLTAGEELFGPIRRQLLEGAEPPVLIADPVYLAAFVRHLRRTGQTPPPLRAVICTYELLTPSTRDLLASAFNCPIRTQYGSSEINDIADECEEGSLHVRMDEVVVEVLRGGRPAAPGELGRVVVTDLRNTNMPLLRYDIGDVARAGEGPCPCGRAGQILGAIEGRAGDVFEAEGREITPLAVDSLFRGLPGWSAYRVVQAASRRRYRLSVMAAEESAFDGLRRALEPRARRLFGEKARVRVERVREIEPEASNKFRFSYSRLGRAALPAPLALPGEEGGAP
ncbi:MAG: hypothetical protein AAF725_05870 [Acidobacteriota bacterium]